ncbi:histidine phosphatase family protein [Celeribacter indicus]|uniref:histidine phosphatase family protein n=1 Tax=Celeribacter indicus TaxID=1208324 RepID=UPI0008985543|nr:histidine phosphatase family protein [Celeribacter indicus]SDW60339.1 probable phosphoglycerate mutase [Celeribacter indicus]
MIPLLSHPFLFLRHGQTAANAANRIGGTTDDPLDRTGLAQAEAAARLLADRPLGAIWHSPLVRARQTALAVARVTGAPMRSLPGLAERNWGVWEGQDRAVLIREATPPGGEGPEAFRARIRAALAEITAPFPVLIVAHSGTARELHAVLTDVPFRRLGNAEAVEWRQDRDCHWICTKLSPDR